MIMSERSYELHGVHLLECSPEGPKLGSDRDALDLISAAWGHHAKFLVIPAERLTDDFFQLKTRVAGEMIHRITLYKMRVAITGDISRHLDESSAFRDFVYEANRGNQVWFVASIEELEERLKSEQA
jgi:hypothetical protein